MALDTDKHLLIFFMDGVGLGNADPDNNPFLRADLRNLNGLLGQKWFLRQENGGPGRIGNELASLVPTDPNLGVPGRPQSATGQASILTGLNVPRIIGEHYGPKPNRAVADLVRQNNLFQETIAAGGKAALLTPYPERYFQAISSGKRLLSSVPLAATSAGLSLMTADDLREGKAISPGFTGQAWRDYLGYDDIPILGLREAGARIAAAAREYHFSFFEHWPSDRSGHRGTLDEAIEHLEMIDVAIGGLTAGWDHDHGLLIITSDHGNIEEKNHRRHSRNPVPTILMGPGHQTFAAQINDLTDIAPVVRLFLGF